MNGATEKTYPYVENLESFELGESLFTPLYTPENIQFLKSAEDWWEERKQHSDQKPVVKAAVITAVKASTSPKNKTTPRPKK